MNIVKLKRGEWRPSFRLRRPSFRLLFSLCIKRPKLLLPDIPGSLMHEKLQIPTFLSLINRLIGN